MVLYSHCSVVIQNCNNPDIYTGNLFNNFVINIDFVVNGAIIFVFIVEISILKSLATFHKFYTEHCNSSCELF
jgi:hypothetical protein